MDKQPKRVPKFVAVAAIVAGLAAGSYGVASAASGSGSSPSSSSSSSSGASLQLAARGTAAPPGGQPWGRQRSDETLLIGEAKAKVRAAALSRITNGTIVRIETDADGNAAYEAHMTKADGTPVTVYLDKQFDVVGVESR
jgi:hypothetical protein